MSLAARVAQRFALTIMNAGTAAVALGSAYLAHKNPDFASPIDKVKPLTAQEDEFIRARMETLGFKCDVDKVVFYKSPIEKKEAVSIGLVGSSSRAHIYVPESYLVPSTGLFRDAYPRLLKSNDYTFEFEGATLASANQNEAFQEARKKFITIEPVLVESYEEMDMSLKSAALKLKLGAEKEIIKAGATWIATFTIIHQVAAFFIRPVMLFPLLPCAFGIGGMVYKGWKFGDDTIEMLADTPQNAAVLAHHLSAELMYNKERRQFMSAPQKWFVTSAGNDWLTDLLSGPTSRKHAVAQNALVGQIFQSQKEDESVQKELGKHFKPKEEQKDIL